MRTFADRPAGAGFTKTARTRPGIRHRDELCVASKHYHGTPPHADFADFVKKAISSKKSSDHRTSVAASLKKLARRVGKKKRVKDEGTMFALHHEVKQLAEKQLILRGFSELSTEIACILFVGSALLRHDIVLEQLHKDFLRLRGAPLTAYSELWWHRREFSEVLGYHGTRFERLAAPMMMGSEVRCDGALIKADTAKPRTMPGSSEQPRSRRYKRLQAWKTKLGALKWRKSKLSQIQSVEEGQDIACTTDSWAIQEPLATLGVD